MVSRKTSRPVVFGWIESAVRVCGQELVHEGLVDGASGAHFAVLVVLLLAIGGVAHGGIDEDITRAGVKVAEVRVKSTFVVDVKGDEADVSNAARCSSRCGAWWGDRRRVSGRRR